MAVKDASFQEAVDFFQSLQIPIPAYKPVEGQLKNDIEYALQRLQQCNVIVSEDIGLQLKIAYALKCVDRRDEAAAAFQQIKDATDNIRLRIIAFIEEGTLLDQKPVLEAGIRLAEEHPQIFDGDEFLRLHMVERGKYQLGWLHYQEGDFRNAVTYLEAGLLLPRTIDPTPVHYNLGISHARIGDYSKAVEHLNAYISLGGPGSDVYQELGDSYFASGKYREAVEAFVQAAKLAGEVASESYRWWCAGTVAAEHCQDHEQACQYLIPSLKAALKIQDPKTQARRLVDASTWLNICVRVNVRGKPMDQLLRDTERVTPRDPQEPLKILKAEAYGTLGIAMLTYQSLDDAREYLQSAIRLLTEEEGNLQNRQRLLLFKFQWAEAALYSVMREPRKALQIFQQCESIAPTEKERLLCQIKSCFEKKSMGDFLTAAATLANLKAENASLLETEWDLKAELLLGLGQSLLGVGDTAQALVHLEAARKILDDQGCYTSELLPVTYAMLYIALIQSGLFPSAFDLISRFHTVISEHHKESDNEQLLNLFAACTSRILVDNESSKDTLTGVLEQQHVEDPRLKCAILCALGDVYRNQEDYEAAQAKYDEAISLIPSDDVLLSSQLYINRAGLYRSKAVDAEMNADGDGTELNNKALHDYDQAIEILEESKVLPLDLANAYAGQAVVLFHLDDYGAASSKLDRAMNLAGSNQLLKAKIKRIRAHLLGRDAKDGFKQSIYEAREAALLFAEVQMKLQHLESAWVTLLEGDMKHLFFLLQTLWVERGSYRDAVLWAERGRMRLYFHLADQRFNLDGNLDPLAFDKDDDLMGNCIANAVKGCGQGSVVVEYTYSPARTLLYIFVLRAAPDLAVEFKRIDLKKFFSTSQNKTSGGTLDALVRRTRTEIKRKAEEKAKSGLGVLYRLLLQPVWDVVNRHETIIFAPHGNISLVPFAALYDESCSQFLVEKKKVGVIPSLRALQRCQVRYEEIKSQQTQQQAVAFVAGDPEPMGLNCGQLRGAREEAIEIAKQFGVAPLIGTEMTKQAVTEGLQSNCTVVALVTHGVVDAVYPRGALVMQGKQKQISKAVDIDRLVLGSQIVPRQSTDILQQSSEVLTANEIEKLDIHAALVVLSACQTGEGEVPSEGLLGLGRAVLQAGTSCAVVTLWRVDDAATKQLMTGMFQELNNEQTVVEALRLSMLKLLNSKAPVYKWASAAALGFPMLKLSAGSNIDSSPPQELRPVPGREESGQPSPMLPTSPRRNRKKCCRCWFCCWKS